MSTSARLAPLASRAATITGPPSLLIVVVVVESVGCAANDRNGLDSPTLPNVTTSGSVKPVFGACARDLNSTLLKQYSEDSGSAEQTCVVGSGGPSVTIRNVTRIDSRGRTRNVGFVTSPAFSSGIWPEVRS